MKEPQYLESQVNQIYFVVIFTEVFSIFFIYILSLLMIKKTVRYSKIDLKFKISTEWCKSIHDFISEIVNPSKSKFILTEPI